MQLWKNSVTFVKISDSETITKRRPIRKKTKKALFIAELAQNTLIMLWRVCKTLTTTELQLNKRPAQNVCGNTPASSNQQIPLR